MWMTGVRGKHSNVSMRICWTQCQPLGRLLRFAKAWLHLRQRTQTEECCRHSPLCGERQRNVGSQATYCTLTPVNTARGLEPRRKAGATDPTVTMPLTTSMCDIIPISAGHCWFNPARLSKHWVSLLKTSWLTVTHGLHTEWPFAQSFHLQSKYSFVSLFIIQWICVRDDNK